jgi:hypothetical protein
LGDLRLEQCFLKQPHVDIFNIFRFNYDEMIARSITVDPKHQWIVGDMAKALFTAQSTLRRHLAKEGLSFSQLML